MDVICFYELDDVLNAFVMICWWKWTGIVSIAVILKHFLFGLGMWFIRVNHFKLSDSTVPLKTSEKSFTCFIKNTMFCTKHLMYCKYCCLLFCIVGLCKWKWFRIICVCLVWNCCKHALIVWIRFSLCFTFMFKHLYTDYCRKSIGIIVSPARMAW